MKVLKNRFLLPEGFKVSSINCGIKRSGKKDLALLFSKVACASAATFTVNKMKSGSVVLSEAHIKKGLSQAVIVNSGNANCCVGKKELEDAKSITSLVAKKLNLKKDLVLIASTGIIGRELPVNKIKSGVTPLIKTLKKGNGSNFSKAIMTTDTVPKEVSVKIKIASKWISVSGVAKGSGMISPNMATMLAFFVTDVCIEKSALKSAFKESISSSFNRITVDGDMSTNDTAIILANGTAKNKTIKKGTKGYFSFLNALKFLSTELAKKIVLDGEGATKFVEVIVKGAKDIKIAQSLARHIASSNLIKTMIAGGDPNWGRVAASIGSSGAKVNKNKVDIYFGKKPVMKNGSGTKVPRKALLDLFKKKEILVTVDLKSGKKSSKIWTCDLTEDYVKINAEYET